jgi:hypothetical protein
MRFRAIIQTVIFSACLGGNAQALAAAAADAGDPCMQAMDAEIARSMEKLQLPGKQKPYYLRYELTDLHSRSFASELGSKTSASEIFSRSANADLRVGNRQDDNSACLDPDNKYQVAQRTFPTDDDYGGVRRQLWLLTDAAYKQAVERFEKVQTYRRGHATYHPCDTLSVEAASTTVLPPVEEFRLPENYNSTIAAASKIFQDYPSIRTSWINFDIQHMTRRVATSEGTHSKYSRNNASLGVVAYARTPDGQDTWDVDYFSADLEKYLPQESELETRIRRLAENLTAERLSERLDYYYGPVLFDSQATAEIVQHCIAPLLCAIPGDQLQPGSKTLLQSFNTRVLPEFIGIIDNPHLDSFAGKPVAGHASIDSDGLPTQKVTLIDHGFLRNFLSGRSPVYQGEHSNGHNISNDITQTTLILEASKTVTRQALKAKLLEIAKARGMKEALEVRRIVPDIALVLQGGQIDARSDRINSNRLAEIYLINVETGKEKRVRGLKLVNFDRARMDGVLSAGDDQTPQTTSSWHGYVRTIICPSLLVDHVELEEDVAESLTSYPVTNPAKN